jgi:hypothetical protein
MRQEREGRRKRKIVRRSVTICDGEISGVTVKLRL